VKQSTFKSLLAFSFCLLVHKTLLSHIHCRPTDTHCQHSSISLTACVSEWRICRSTDKSQAELQSLSCHCNTCIEQFWQNLNCCTALWLSDIHIFGNCQTIKFETLIVMHNIKNPWIYLQVTKRGSWRTKIAFPRDHRDCMTFLCSWWYCETSHLDWRTPVHPTYNNNNNNNNNERMSIIVT